MHLAVYDAHYSVLVVLQVLYVEHVLLIIHYLRGSAYQCVLMDMCRLIEYVYSAALTVKLVH